MYRNLFGSYEAAYMYRNLFGSHEAVYMYRNLVLQSWRFRIHGRQRIMCRGK